MSEQPAPPCVFVSYATADIVLAQYVARVLERRLESSAEVFVAKRDIRPGSDPLATILAERLLHATALVALCSRESRNSPWLWWESSSVWTRRGLVVPLFVDVEAGEFGGPLVLVRQGRRVFDAGDLSEALRAVVEYVVPGLGGSALEEGELSELRNIEGEYRRRRRTRGATRLGLLERLRELVLECKNGAREAIDNGDQVTHRLIDAERHIKTTMKQLGDDDFPLDLVNFASQAQNALSVMQWWQAADAIVEKMIIEATE